MKNVKRFISFYDKKQMKRFQRIHIILNSFESLWIILNNFETTHLQFIINYEQIQLQTVCQKKHQIGLNMS